MGGEIAVADIGGTNARFARARVTGSGRVELSEPVMLATADFDDLPGAFRAFLAREGDFSPQGAAFALAGPVGDAPFKLTNADWHFDPAQLPSQLGLEKVTLLNDFAAIAHAAAGAPDGDLAHLAGPDRPLARTGTVTVIGPGTGVRIHAEYPFNRDNGKHGIPNRVNARGKIEHQLFVGNRIHKPRQPILPPSCSSGNDRVHPLV